MASIAVTKSPMMVFVSAHYEYSIAWADEATPTGYFNGVFGEGIYPSSDVHVRCMTPFRGEVYAVQDGGDIVSTNIQVEQRASTVKMARIISGPVFEEICGVYKFYLVESEGDQLVVLGGVFAEGQPVLYRVDTEKRCLEAVGDIGSHAFFVNFNRSISVSTRVHPSTVLAGCIYYAYLSYIRAYNHDLKAWD